MRRMSIPLKLAIMAFAAVVLAVPRPIAAIENLFVPSADLWPKWQAQTRGSTQSVDHTVWDRLLATYLERGADGINRFDYGAVTAADRQALDAYISALAGTTVRDLDRAEQLPYWINLYNALTVQVVLDHYPVDSIRDIDISPGLFAVGPWDKELVRIEGEDMSLNDIEHRILRPIWQDPRIHYAVNCAALGCPNLQMQAFTRSNADALMTAGARAYVNHPRGVRAGDGRITTSSIYHWFEEDFGGSDAGIIAHLRRYAEPDLAARLGEAREVGDHGYDWSLNDAR